MFMFRGPPIYASGHGENADIAGVVPAPVAAIAASVVVGVSWTAIPDQVFTQGQSAARDLSAYATIPGGYPLRLTLAPSSAALPAGITWNEQTKSLVATAPPTATTVSGVILRAVSGILVDAVANVPPPVASAAATATQQSAPGPSFGAITAAVPRPNGSVAATATQNPPPSGTRYPNRDIMLTMR